jgi:hypothetical protein
MISVSNLWKIYFLIGYGILIGYFGASDHKNFLILGTPMVFILKNIKFDFVVYENKDTNQVFESNGIGKQHVLAFGLSCVRDVIDLVRTWNAGQHVQVKVKTDKILKKLMNAADPRNILSGNLMMQEEKSIPKIQELKE